MSEHGWPDFHDDGLHHDDGGAHHEEPPPQHDDSGFYDDQHHDDLLEHDDNHLGDHDTPDLHDTPGSHDTPEAHDVHEPAPDHSTDDGTDHGAEHSAEPQHELHTVGADPDALPEPDTAEAVTVFPPVLDVGPLPEPVDGFPWIDTGSLGVLDPAAVHAAVPTDADVSPQDLADYAGTELPPGADPWTALAGSDDPATSALAKWWSEHS
jgi:hypothetical protein